MLAAEAQAAGTLPVKHTTRTLMPTLPEKIIPWLPALLAVAIALFVGGWASLRIRIWLDRLQRVRRSRRADIGEDRARMWLSENGFAIVGEQESMLCEMRVDGEPIEYEVCVDFLVERNSERAVVEVKTGGAARPSSPATRRQIFEYASLYGVDRAYMFDGDQSTLHEIVFQVAPPSYTPREKRITRWQIGIVGFLVGALCAAALISQLTR